MHICRSRSIVCTVPEPVHPATRERHRRARPYQSPTSSHAHTAHPTRRNMCSPEICNQRYLSKGLLACTSCNATTASLRPDGWLAGDAPRHHASHCRTPLHLTSPSPAAADLPSLSIQAHSTGASACQLCRRTLASALRKSAGTSRLDRAGRGVDAGTGQL